MSGVSFERRVTAITHSSHLNITLQAPCEKSAMSHVLACMSARISLVSTTAGLASLGATRSLPPLPTSPMNVPPKVCRWSHDNTLSTPCDNLTFTFEMLSSIGRGVAHVSQLLVMSPSTSKTNKFYSRATSYYRIFVNTQEQPHTPSERKSCVITQKSNSNVSECIHVHLSLKVPTGVFTQESRQSAERKNKWVACMWILSPDSIYLRNIWCLTAHADQI